MDFSKEVTTITNTKIIPKVFDTVTKGSPLLLKTLQNAKEWKSGTKYETVIKYQGTTNGGNTGIADKLDTNRQNTRERMSWSPKQAYKPVVIASIETVLNSGDERILDLFETEFDSQAQELSNDMAYNVYNGSGVGNSWDSLANAADDGTNFVNYGGLSRTTYPTIKGYYLAGAGALSLEKMSTAYDAVSVGSERPDLLVTTKALWSAYEILLKPMVRQNYTTSGYPKMNAFGLASNAQGVAGDYGFDTVFFRGKGLVADEQAQSGSLYLINTNNFFFAGINYTGKDFQQLNLKKTSDGTPAGVVGNVPMTRGFNFRTLMKPVDQLAEVGYLLYTGNFISSNPRLQGQVRGLTTT